MRRAGRLLPLALAACVPALPEPVAPDTTALAVGASRTVELRSLRMEVDDFEQVIDLPRLRTVAPDVLDRIWLLDVPLDGLVANALDGLARLTEPEARALPVPAQNMRRLLNTTPDNVLLDGTSLDAMTELAAALGIPPGRVLAELLDVGLTEPVIPRDLATDVLVEDLIGTHPATRWRQGPVDAAHPDGRWAVAPNSLPVTLGDIVSGFAGLVDRFGPADTPEGRHPGFIQQADGVTAVSDDFVMVVKVDANALPFRGLDLTSVTDAAIHSTPSQIDTLFPTADPDWLRIEGLVPEPSISTLTVGITEDDAWHDGGASREPAPRGASTAWDLPPWVFERLIVEMGYRSGLRTPAHCVERVLGTGTKAFEACVEGDGWTTFRTFAGLGDPPAPAYLWDLTLELAEVRLHDGGLAEGGGDVAFTLHDVGLGVSADDISDQARANVAADPTILRDLATVLTENGVGSPDVVYVRGATGGPEAAAGDWLWFVAPGDVPTGEDGLPVRPYRYARPGFFADEALSTKVSAVDVGGEDEHEKVQVAPGDVLYVEDDDGAVFRVEVGDKPSLARLAVTVTRVR